MHLLTTLNQAKQGYYPAQSRSDKEAFLASNGFIRLIYEDGKPPAYWTTDKGIRFLDILKEEAAKA